MKYNMANITFWFNEVENFIEYQNILNKELNEDFTTFNLISVPSAIDPIIPRICSSALDRHTVFNMSKINVQININFDNDFSTDFDKCYKYIKEKTIKILEVLVGRCNLRILYSAIHINFEYEEKNPIKKIIDNLFNNSFNSRELEEIGVRLSKKLDDKFYYIFAINDAKVVSFDKKIKQVTNNIVIPLISEKDITIEKKVLSFDLEINDKYSFNKKKNYNSNIDVLKIMFKKFLEIINSLCENIVKDKII